nr:Pycsar system effector family protein [Sphaerisporangium rubeum]
MSDTVEWLWWAGVAMALATLACLAGAVYPRLGGPPGDAVEYFGDVVRYESGDALAAALLAARGHELRRLSGQVRRVGQIVSRKYLLIRWGFWLLSGAILSTMTAVALDLLIRGV